MANDSVIKPVLDLNHIKCHEIFALPTDIRIIVSKRMKNAIEKANLTGLSFSKVSAK